MSGASHPIADVPGVAEAVTFVKFGCIRKLPVPWPRCQELQSSDTAVPAQDDLTVAISHAWPYQVHPDPLGEKVRILGELVEKAIVTRKPQGKTLLFFDLLSVPQRPFQQGQRPRTPEEDERFAIGLKAFPTIYLMADATVHVDVNLSAVPSDGEIYTVPLGTLRELSLLQLGPSVQVVASESNQCKPFDFVLRAHGAEVKTMRDVEQALEKERRAPASPTFQLGCSCTSPGFGSAEMCSAQFGKRNTLSANVKGWIYLERFASMVKVAMTHESQIDGLVFTNSDVIREQIFSGGARLRAAVAKGFLKEELDRFAEELGEKQFSAASIDKQTNTGGQGGLTTADINASVYSGSDQDVVWRLMQEMVDYLSANWAKEQRAQEHRQLVLAVGRQDVGALESILSARADPDVADQRGTTLLHEAAVGHNTEVLRVLLRHGANTLIQDEMRAIPAHRIFLKMDANADANFRLLAPSRRELEVRNKAGITPLQRFYNWGSLADSGEAFPPAMAVLDELRLRFPDLQIGQGDDASDDFDAGTRVIESTVECSVGSRTVDVRVWENAASAEHHVLHLALQAWVPTAGQLSGARTVSRQVAAEFPVRIHTLTWSAMDESIFRSGKKGVELREALLESMLAVVEALPLKEKFVLVDDTTGGMSPLLWRLHARQRLAGAVVVNFGCTFPPEVVESEMYNVAISMGAHWSSKYVQRDIGWLKTQMDNMTLVPEREMRMKSRARFEEDMKNEPTSAFWLWHEHWCGDDFMTNHKLLAVFSESLADKFPIVVGLSDQAPDFLVGQPTMRFLPLVGAEETNYIPNSKCMWPYEGAQQSGKVSMLLAEAISRSFSLPEPTASRSPKACGPERTTAEAPGKAAAEVTKGSDASPGSDPACCSVQ